MSDNVWTPGQDERPTDGAVDLGEPRYERGVPLWLAFWVPHFFRNAVAVTREQPTLVYGSAAVVACLSVVTTVVNELVQRLLLASFDAGAFQIARPEDLLPIYGAALGILLPVLIVGALAQTWINAGAQVAIANFVRTDRVSMAAVFLSARHAVSRLGYQALCWLLVVVAYVALVFAFMLVAVAAGTLGPSGAFLLLVLLLLVLVAFGVGAIWVAITLVPGVYAATLDTNPLEAFGVSFASVEGARLRLLLLWAMEFAATFALAVVAFVAAVIADFIGPLGILLTVGWAIVAALPMTVVFGFWNAGVATSWMLHSRDADEARKWPCVVRNALYPEG